MPLVLPPLEHVFLGTLEVNIYHLNQMKESAIMSDQVKQLIEQATRMDDAKLRSTYNLCKDRVLNGKTIDGLNTTDSLRITGVLRQMVQDRVNGTTTKQESLDVLAARLARDVGMSPEQAKAWISERGNPYDPQQRKVMLDSGWDGQERRGIRKPGFTADDVAADQGGQSDDAPEQRTVRRQHNWGE
jgi:hypothetical protein